MPIEDLRSHSASRVRRQAFAAVLVLVACLTLFRSLGYWRSFEARLQDKMIETREPSGDVVIVAIDDASISAIGRWPWPRTAHARMLDRLTQSGAAAIGYDVTFSEPSSEAEDAALETALRATPHAVLPKEVVLHVRGNLVTGFDTRVLPLDRFVSAVKERVGHTTLLADPDGIVRHAAPVDSFAALLADCCETSGAVLRIPFYGVPGTFTTYAFSDVLEGRVPEEAFKGKIVLVGATAPDLHDEAQTSVGEGRPMSGVEIQATLTEALREHSALGELSSPLVALLFAVLASCTAVLLWRLRLRYCLLALPGLLFTYLIVALLMASHGWLLPVWYPCLIIIGTAVIELGARYVTERDHRRHIRDAFGRYLAPQVIRKIETGEVPLVLGGARREATILFSDIRGFTALSERLDPEALVSLLNDYLTAMTSEILAQEGVVDKYIGDAIMAFWNAPVPQEDHAIRAARAALGMRDRLVSLHEEWKGRGVPDVQIGIGLNCGDVVIGNMGSEQRFDYTAIGDEVNLASRLEGLTKYYGVTILISDAVRRKLGEAFFCRRLDLVTVKGKERPVAVYELMGETRRIDDNGRALASRFEAALASLYARRWDEAEVAFLDIAEQHHDHAARLYVERCRAYRVHPPAADWDGRWIATEK